MVRGHRELHEQRTTSGYVASSKLDKVWEAGPLPYEAFLMNADALSWPVRFNRMLTHPQDGHIYQQVGFQIQQLVGTCDLPLI